MAEKLIIVMANTDPRNGEELGAPIFQATVAAAMEYEVDVICTATSGRLENRGAEFLAVTGVRIGHHDNEFFCHCCAFRFPWDNNITIV